MATSSPLLKEHEQVRNDKETDLTRCGICLCPIQNPKALPCLHAFCFSCLVEWAKDETEKVKCSVCKDEFPLPLGGVAEFKSNFYVIKLKESQAMKDNLLKKTIKCTFCEEANNDAIARCLDCKDYLCSRCVGLHRTYKGLKGHKVQSFDDIRSGKVNVHKIGAEEHCTKHKSQALWFFCETCGELICRDCTVVNHPAATHKLVNVEDVSGDQGMKLKDLSERCQKVAQEVKEMRQNEEDLESNLDEALDIAKQELEQSVAQIESKFLGKLRESKQELSDQIDQIGSYHKSQINRDKDALQTQNLQLNRALQMTAHVTEKGSPYDMAAMYTTLTNTLQRLSDIKPCKIDKSLAGVRFEADTMDEVEIPKLGEVIDEYKGSMNSGDSQKQKTVHDLSGTWIKESEICQNGGLSDAKNMAFHPSGNIAIASYDSSRVAVFTSAGQFKHTIDINQDSKSASHPRSVVINSDGTAFVTDESASVKVFDKSAILISRFETYSPGVSQTPSSESKLAGLTMAHNNNIIVGDTSGKYISIHKQSGEHVKSFGVSIEPWFMGAAQNRDNIVISAGNWYGGSAHIITSRGQVLHTINQSPVSGMAWCPTGACFNGDDEFLIASYSNVFSGTRGGIYRFSTDGKFLDCITKDVNDPTDVAVTKGGQIMVLESDHVKMFKAKLYS